MKLKDIVDDILLENSIREVREDIRNVKFVRYGGLSPVIQHGYGNDGFHSPPAKKGIYAFPYPFIEQFLLGGYPDPKSKEIKNPTNRIKYVRGSDGKPIDSNHPEYPQHAGKEKNWSMARGKDVEGYPTSHVLYRNTSRKIFEYKGEVWHHLPCKPNEVLKRHNDWVLSDYNNYTKALAKEIHKIKFNTSNAPEWSGEKKKNFKGNRVEKAPLNHFSKDHLEVFIERVK